MYRISPHDTALMIVRSACLLLLLLLQIWRRGRIFANIRRAAVWRRSFRIRLVAWRSGSIIRRMNEVAIRWARLLMGWVTVFWRVYNTTSVYITEPTRSTQHMTYRNGLDYRDADGRINSSDDASTSNINLVSFRPIIPLFTRLCVYSRRRWSRFMKERLDRT